MRVVCISDTHNQLQDIEIPEGDLLLHAGDLSMSFSTRTPHILAEQIVILSRLPHKHKVFVAGNHDFGFQNNKEAMLEFMQSLNCPSLHYLEHESIELNIRGRKIKIFGSPWQPYFHDWAFNLPRGPALAKKWEDIPLDTDIVLTHTPAGGYLDQCGKNHVGCHDLTPRLLLVKPKLHVSGHIHVGHGEVTDHGIHFINAAIIGRGYKPANEPYVVDLCRYCDGDHLSKLCCWGGPSLLDMNYDKEGKENGV